VLRFSTVTSTQELDRLRDEWSVLDDGERPGAVFRSWEWQATWWRTLGARRGRRLHIVCARDGSGRLRGLLPLYVDVATVGGVLPYRRLGLLSDGVVGSDYLGLIAPAAERTSLAGRFATHLASDPVVRDTEQIDLTNLELGDPLVIALERALAGAGFQEIAILPRYRCPFAQLDEDLDGYLWSRPRGFGVQALKRRNELAAERGFRLDVVRAPDPVVAGLEHLLALHRARWADEGGSDAIPSPGVEVFHREAATQLAARGWARLAVLLIGGRAVAAGYGFARGHRFVYYQAGLDPAWRHRSVGTVVLGELIRCAFEEGLREFDFLHGEESYKATWATHVRETCRLHARPRSVRAQVTAHARATISVLRSNAHRLLPGRAVELVRCARRRLDRRTG
jgi:CelD/BcsL family acetyltransferase involved in cellulose biosynthesis